MRQRRLAGGARVLAVAALASALAAACVELGTGVDDISYIAFDGIPWPAVLAGDSLRDSLGVAAPLRASAFDANGRPVADAPFRYFTLDTGVVLDSAGTLRATTRRNGTVRVIAALGALQSDDRLIRVSRRPDSAYAAQNATQTLGYAIPDRPTNVSGDLRFLLTTTDTAGGLANGVGGWIVRWRTVFRGDTLAAGDTTLVALLTTAGARRVVDTTAADGASIRRLRVFVERLPAPADSFIVLADVRLHGAPVPGSPVRFVVHVSPRSP